MYFFLGIFLAMPCRLVAHFFSFLRVSPMRKQRRRCEQKKRWKINSCLNTNQIRLEFVQKSRFICLSIEQIVQTNRCFLLREKRRRRGARFFAYSNSLVFRLENNISAIFALNCIDRDDVVGENTARSLFN